MSVLVAVVLLVDPKQLDEEDRSTGGQVMGITLYCDWETSSLRSHVMTVSTFPLCLLRR